MFKSIQFKGNQIQNILKKKDFDSASQDDDKTFDDFARLRLKGETDDKNVPKIVENPLYDKFALIDARIAELGPVEKEEVEDARSIATAAAEDEEDRKSDVDNESSSTE